VQSVGRCRVTSLFYRLPNLLLYLLPNLYLLKNSAILDSGSTIHVFNEATRFLNFQTAPDGDFVWAGEHKVPILGYGDIDIQIRDLKGSRIMRLFDVAYCQNFASNLVSLRQLHKQGYW
jgi:hypothetical protein